MAMLGHESVLEVASSAASKAIAGGSVVAVFGGFTSTDIAAFGGLLIAVIGLGWKLYVDKEILKIERERRISEENFHREEMLERRKNLS